MNEALQRDALAARAEVRSGALRGEAFARRLLAVPYAERDAWADALLGLPDPPPDEPLPPGAVPYLPAAVEEIVALARGAPLRPGDALVDLGSGLGRVVILAHLLSGARAHGVELQASLVREACACRDRLGLGPSEVSFACADAAEVELDGSAFFLYAPFNGELLARVLRRVEGVARRRPIVVGAVAVELLGERWLARRESPAPTLTLYDSVLR